MIQRALVFLLLVQVQPAVTAREGGSALPPVDLGPHRIPRAGSPIAVDGSLDEPAWRSAWSMELGFEVQPGENVSPPVRTVVLVTFDDRAVYFAFRAHDPEPERIRAHLSDRDNVGADDWVAVVLDTFNDERRSFDFLVNPLGVQNDFVEAQGSDNGSWDTIWDSAGRITDWGYAVEMRVPFSSLRFQRADGPQIWGFDAVRSYPRSVRHHIGLFPRDRNNNCYLCQAVKIEGFEGANPGRNLELAPTLTGLRTDAREDLPDGELVEGDADVEAGVTARWGLTPNLTLSGTVNPDFSQVEADARQLAVNQRFALFYAEKRPFFMEGADYFSTPLPALHTRTMADPTWGVKLSGKEEGNTVGVYLVEDDVTTLLLPGSQGSSTTSLEQASTAAVLRYRRDLGSRFTVGGLYTGREGEGYSNHLLGFDGRLRLTDTDRVDFQVLGSRTAYPDDVTAEHEQPEGRFEDWAMELAYEHVTRHLDAWGIYNRTGEGFRADLGFIPQVDVERALGGVAYKWVPDGRSWYSDLQLWLEQYQEEETDGELLLRQTTLGVTYEGPLQSHAVLQLYRRTEGFNGERFEIVDTSLHNCMKPTGDMHLYVNLLWGDRVDYANNRPGRRLRVQPGAVLNLGRHLALELEHLYERMSAGGDEVYTANITQGTAAYQFSTRAFLRLILQHEDDRFNLRSYDDPGDLEPEVRELSAQLLFSYTLNPQTVLFIGYSEGQAGSRDYGLTTSDRTLFVKLGYAWVF